MATKTLSIDELLVKIEEADAYKKQAIDQILEERKALDDKLARLGYKEPSGKNKEEKKRHRRTKQEIEAARAEGEK
jgi:hypothetical protein